jgi:hypothetical protein
MLNTLLLLEHLECGPKKKNTEFGERSNNFWLAKTFVRFITRLRFSNKPLRIVSAEHKRRTPWRLTFSYFHCFNTDAEVTPTTFSHIRVSHAFFFLTVLQRPGPGPGDVLIAGRSWIALAARAAAL